MAQLLILTSAVDTEVLPALGLLSHKTRQIPAEPASLITAPTCDLILVDARFDLASAKSLCKILNTTGVNVPLILILTFVVQLSLRKKEGFVGRLVLSTVGAMVILAVATAVLALTR